MWSPTGPLYHYHYRRDAKNVDVEAAMAAMAMDIMETGISTFKEKQVTDTHDRNNTQHHTTPCRIFILDLVQ